MDHTLHIIADDPAVLDALGFMLSLEGYAIQTFTNVADFVSHARRQPPDCVILDLHRPDHSGPKILRDLRAGNGPPPILVISEQGDIPLAVRAIKDGAHDIIEKPFDAETIVACVREAIRTFAGRGLDKGAGSGQDFLQNNLLTPRERDVLQQITAGLSNKQAGRNLGISPRTVEVHRAHIMEKLGARNVAELVCIVLRQKTG